MNSILYDEVTGQPAGPGRAGRPVEAGRDDGTGQTKSYQGGAHSADSLDTELQCNGDVPTLAVCFCLFKDVSFRKS